MITFLIIQLKTAIILCAFYGVYWLFLQKQSHFAWNRAYLLILLLLSVALPYVKIPLPSDTSGQAVTIILDTITVDMSDIGTVSEEYFTFTTLIALVYLAGVAFFTLRFLLRLRQLFFIIRHAEVIRQGKNKCVYTTGKGEAFSFLGFIFISRDICDDDADKIMAHESAHIKQLHSADRIILEIVSIVQWFNPLMPFVRQSLKDIHEYLADAAVISGGVEQSDYRRLIL